jgi:hypothetical protein
MKFRKKPVEIEAHQYDGDWQAALDWCQNVSAGANGTGLQVDNGKLSIITLEGVMKVGYLDWIICGVKGEFYPCKPDIFEATYEPVEEPKDGAG